MNLSAGTVGDVMLVLAGLIILFGILFMMGHSINEDIPKITLGFRIALIGVALLIIGVLTLIVSPNIDTPSPHQEKAHFLHNA